MPARGARPVTPTGRSPRIHALDLPTTLKHLRSTDLKEVWVPDILAFQDLIADSKTVLADAHSRIRKSGPFDPLVEVEVPKTPFFNRTASLLSFEDRVAFQSVVATLVDAIDSRLLPLVYSARASTDSRFFLRNDRDQWLLFRTAVGAEIEAGNEWMIKTDLSSYFDTIPHGLLFKDLDGLKPDPLVSRALKRMLSIWSDERGLGLVQGPNASRVLGNFFLQPVDMALSDGRWRYLPFMDDIRIVGSTRHDVTSGFGYSSVSASGAASCFRHKKLS